MTFDRKLWMQTYAKKYRSEHREELKAKGKNWHYQKRLGISYIQAKAILEHQGFKCAICGKDNKKLGLDHSHKTGQVREWLCDYCNSAVAVLENGRLARLCRIYLHKHKELAKE